jgi:tetratricopeptide (TPR) repeat protein
MDAPAFERTRKVDALRERLSHADVIILLLFALGSGVVNVSAFWPVLILVGSYVLFRWIRWLTFGRHTDDNAHGDAERSPRDYLVPRELPPALHWFVGREREMQLIEAHLRRAGVDGPKLVRVEGKAGIGKTALAIRAAHAVADHFPDGQLFVQTKKLYPHGKPAAEVTTAELRHELLGRIVSGLRGPSDPVAASPHDRLDQYRQLIRLRPRILVVIDDTDDADLVRSILLGGSYGAMIVTGREHLAGLPYTPLMIRLAGLDKAASVRLLRLAVGDERIASEPIETREIVAATAGEPISLHAIAASLIARPHIKLSTVLRHVNEGARVDAAPREVDSLSLSFALLTEQEQLTFLRLGLLPDRSFAGWMLAALMETDESDAVRMADRLLHAGLIERTGSDSGGAPLFTVPSPVHEYARVKVAESMPEQERTRLGQALAEATQGRQMKPTRALKSEVYTPFLEGDMTTALRGARRGVALARDRGDAASESLALAAFAEVSAELGNFEVAREFASAAIAKDGGLGQVRALRCLGMIERRLRRLRASESHLLHGLHEVSERDFSERIRLLRDLSVTYAAGKDPDQAIARIDEAFRHHRSRYEEGSPHAPALLWARGVALEAAGKHSDALEVIAEGQRRASVLGQRLWQAWLLHQHATVALSADRTDLSRDKAFEAVTLFGEMDHRYGKAHGRLLIGRSYLVNGRPDEARPSLEEAAQDFANCGDKWTRAEALRMLALAHGSIGNTRRAVYALQTIKAIFEDLGDSSSIRQIDTDVAGLVDKLPNRAPASGSPATSGSIGW